MPSYRQNLESRRFEKAGFTIMRLFESAAIRTLIPTRAKKEFAFYALVGNSPS